MITQVPKLRIFNADVPVTTADVRALNDFLRGTKVQDESALHELLEKHPALVGVLGFTEFSSEHPLYKRCERSGFVPTDGRRRDRADLLAAKNSTLQHKSAHIIELKSAATMISERGYGTRLSPDASHAIEQLREYKHWLTTVEANHRLLDSLGWHPGVPTLHLIMGTSAQFLPNPAHLDELKGLVQERGVNLLTVDDLVMLADKSIRARRTPLHVIRWTALPPGVPGQVTSRVVVDVNDLLLVRPLSIAFGQHLRPKGPMPGVDTTAIPKVRNFVSLSKILRPYFLGLCAYCRIPDWLGGGPGLYQLDHFRPASLFPELKYDFKNIVYACLVCCLLRDGTWPNPAQKRRGARFVDPFGPLHNDFEEQDDFTWLPRTAGGEYTLRVLELNRKDRVEERRLLRQRLTDGRLTHQ